MGIDSGVAPARRRAVFLDRDGTLNRAFEDDSGVSKPPMTEADLELLPGVPEALAALRAAGFALVVVTNQPDVARGALRREVAERINARLRELLDIDALLCCFHDDADACGCRKPRPGMLFQAARDLNLDLRGSFMVGDRWRDTDAGQEAECTTIQIGNAVAPGHRQPDHLVSSVSEAAAIILNGARV